MTDLLAPLSAVFLVIIIYLLYKIQLDRQKFNMRIKTLEDFIVQISAEQKLQNNKLLLSEELKQRLNAINTTLSKDIYEMNFSLVKKVYPRK